MWAQIKTVRRSKLDKTKQNSKVKAKKWEWEKEKYKRKKKWLLSAPNKEKHWLWMCSNSATDWTLFEIGFLCARFPYFHFLSLFPYHPASGDKAKWKQYATPWLILIQPVFFWFSKKIFSNRRQNEKCRKKKCKKNWQSDRFWEFSSFLSCSSKLNW